MIVDVAAVRLAQCVLASSSPRRVEILNGILGLQVEVVPSTFEENLDKSCFTAHAYVQENARQKALEVYGRLEAQGQAPALVIGADTVVVIDGQILEKPKSREAAVAMLQRLSGRSHEVVTGVALLYRGQAAGAAVEQLFAERTEVEFASLPAALIEAYVESGEPMDKAGSYGIQGRD